MDTPIPVDLGRIAQDLQIRRVQVESVVQLLDEGNTVPFITRYRKERTGNLNEVAIREIQHRVTRLRELAERKQTILKAIEGQGKLSEELAAAIRAVDNPKKLEDLYLPYKPKKRTKASEAREKGLEPLALRIWNLDESLTDLSAAAAEYVDAEKGVESGDQALEGVGHILAESINELAVVRDAVRRVVWKLGRLVTSKLDSVAEGQGHEFRDYFQFAEPIGHIPPHRVLAINRGEKENVIRIKLEVPRAELERAILGQLPLEDHPHSAFFTKAALDALDRLLFPALEREVRRDLTEGAERHAVDVFAKNLRSLLLQPPITGQTVLAIDPGFRTGCKVAVLDPIGQVLEHATIHPHAPQNRRAEAKLTLKDLVSKHSVSVVAIGNGTACRETEELVADIIAEGTYFHTHPEATSMPGAPAPLTIKKDHATSPEETKPEGEIGESSSETSATIASETEAGEGREPEQAAETVAAEASPEPLSAESCAVDPPAESSSASPPETEKAEEIPPIMGGAPEDEPDVAITETGEGTPPIEAMAMASPTPEAQIEEIAVASSNETVTVAETAPQEEAGANGESEFAPVVASTEDAAPAADSPAPAAAPAQRGSRGNIAPAADFSRPPKSSKPPRAASAERPATPPKPARPKGPPPPPKPHPADAALAQLSYVIVNEAGASVYSASPVGREEFPELDATARSVLSIGRRLQDPLAELVKIEPQNIGVGLYQHDINPKQLKEMLASVIESCVNFVGVDLNTASEPLLRHVSGLNALTARRVVEYRKQHGPFTARDQLQQVEGVGAVTFTQAAGFLKIRNGANPLDSTWIHPESYEAAVKFLERLGFSHEIVRDKERLPELHQKLNEQDLEVVAKELGLGEPTLRDLCDALARPERDPRDDLAKPVFKKGILKIEDLAVGMELRGTVLNVVDFGAFVDIGLKDSGLVHISQLANRYIKSPHDVVSVGDVVNVWVMGVDGDRKRVSLTMVRPGSERPRGPAPRSGPGEGDRGRRGGNAPGAGPRGSGGERRADSRPGRPPRREPGAEGSGAGPQQGSNPTAGEPREGNRPRHGARSEGPPPGARIPGPPSGARIPGPPSRSQGAGRGRPRPGSGGGGRYGAGSGPPRQEGTSTPSSEPRPKRTAAPPAPLSTDAIAGNVPLRTFGQLRQFYEARTQPESAPGAESSESAGAIPANVENSDANAISVAEAPAATVDSSPPAAAEEPSAGSP